MKYYNLDTIRANNSIYNIILGKRGNGKTYAVLKLIIDNYMQGGKQGVIIRRYAEDIKPKNSSKYFAPFLDNGYIQSISEFDSIRSYGGAIYLGKTNDELKKVVWSKKPLCYLLSIADAEHTKGGNAYGDVTTILFDEFTTHGLYLKNEFVSFTDLLSTVIRSRQNVFVYMLGNTVDKFCPYFEELGLTHIKAQKQGTIDVYNLVNGFTLSCEYCANNLSESETNANPYFAFDNNYNKMVMKGEWEVVKYPHNTRHSSDDTLLFSFIVSFKSDVLQGDIFSFDGGVYCNMHRKTTPIKDFLLMYGDKHSLNGNVSNNFMQATSKAQAFILSLYKQNKFVYSTNEVGEIFHGFLKACGA